MGRYVSCSVAANTLQRCLLDVVGSCCCQWTVPANTTTATFEIWGGGGAGGPKCCCYCGSSTPGAAGGYSIKTIPVTAGATYTICAGNGGAMVYCSVGGVNQGCAGGTSYVTGTGLTNFCATGGQGGVWTCCNAAAICLGGIGYGGDSNIMGGVGYGHYWNWICSWSNSGAAAFGSEATMHVQQCCPWVTCGACGIFPGGGGVGIVSACCCDCCACNGAGASGYVRVTF